MKYPSKARTVIIDFETLSQEPESLPVVAIGLIALDAALNEVEYCHIAVPAQEQILNFKDVIHSDDTLAWWRDAEEPERVITGQHIGVQGHDHPLFDPDLFTHVADSVAVAFTLATDFIERHQGTGEYSDDLLVWQRRAFDQRVWEAWLKRLHMKNPIHWSKWHDMATITLLLAANDIPRVRPQDDEAHSALADCRADAANLRNLTDLGV